MTSEFHSPLIETVRQLCAERGVRVWLVGGAVRDELLGRVVHDWDLAVERDAIPLARSVANRLDADVYVLDAEHDTARVILAETTLDFARLRVADLAGDLAARDFTINALAIDLDRPAEVIDLFHGADDLDEGIIRAIGEDALTSDPIRLLRAVRQSVSFAFEIDPQTAGWIKKHAALIARTSAERIRDELIKMLIAPGAYDTLWLLDAFELLPHVLPEVTALKGVSQSLPHHWDVFEHTGRVLDSLELICTRWLGIEQADEGAAMLPIVPMFAWDSLIFTLGAFADNLRAHLKAYAINADRSRLSLLKWAALLHDAGKPATRTVEDSGRIRFLRHEELGAKLAADRLRALKFSTDEIDRVNGIIRGHMRPHQLAEAPLTRRAIYRFFRDSQDYGVDILLLSMADHLATYGPDLDQARWVARLGLMSEMLSAYFERREEIVAPPPLVTGDDVMTALGIKPGKQVGVILDAIREAQAAGEVATQEEALALAKQVMQQTTQ